MNDVITDENGFLCKEKTKLSSCSNHMLPRLWSVKQSHLDHPQYANWQTENARIEASKVGEAPELCESGSAFQTSYSDCKECVSDSDWKANEQLDSVFGRYIVYCNGTSSADNSPLPINTSTQLVDVPATTIIITSIPLATVTLTAEKTSTSSNDRSEALSMSSSSTTRTATKSSTESTTDLDSKTSSIAFSPTSPGTGNTLPASPSSTDTAGITPPPEPRDETSPTTPKPAPTLVVGGILSSLFFLIIIALAVYFFRRRYRPRRKSQRISQQQKEKINEMESQEDDIPEKNGRSIDLPAQELEGRPAPRAEMDVERDYVEMDTGPGYSELEVEPRASNNGTSGDNKQGEISQQKEEDGDG
ncbi:hypothetical protein QBC36DRAFT_375363 [Triangularia setosa]|uniref:Uncharacterized protein n=1 Tax=Triangularia setosa TaxID=2587417 RepID=A0AAN7AB85_9PEZI|nr:hypothetical protein QBC36DRAFT_375363 [Podospora setosa]